ncbi:M23 family metallopeptidase [Zavarzinia compransoris]|uniref:M23 family metallopeptidase n=1 Tax=Zavarzinia compransoris TaxID=1264899 RepID=UPI0010EB8772|nr:M23 family metallopeptidase [Zavarzinia compransoris]TDP47756.1 murein DD-endopeptidase MepM/ murein hydrolase activator NlpD [Zavarzinia compransoris]
MIRLLAALALVAAGGARAATIDGEVRQGRLVFGHAERWEEIRYDGRVLHVAPDGGFVLGIGRDAAGELAIEVRDDKDKVTTLRRPILTQDWDIQRIDGLPDKKVNPDPETQERIKWERSRIQAARQADRAAFDWQAGFRWPATGRISGIYGSQRILNGQPRQPHLGLDVAVPTGTPIKAAAAGRVTLAAGDLYFTGGTVIIDHGAGVQTLYAHLSRVDVSEGQAVTAGQTIALSGATGRVTGPHLHFGLAWYGLQLDPAPYLPKAD